MSYRPPLGYVPYSSQPGQQGFTVHTVIPGQPFPQQQQQLQAQLPPLTSVREIEGVDQPYADLANFPCGDIAQARFEAAKHLVDGSKVAVWRRDSRILYLKNAAELASNPACSPRSNPSAVMFFHCASVRWAESPGVDQPFGDVFQTPCDSIGLARLLAARHVTEPSKLAVWRSDQSTFFVKHVGQAQHPRRLDQAIAFYFA